jgi:DNA polymerase-4
MSGKVIVCIDMDCFFVSVERVMRSGLNNKPIIVGGDPQSRGVVSACSYEARECGIHSGMALKKAYKACPDAVFLSPSLSAYRQFSHNVLEILTRYVPIIDQASVDEFYLDLTGCERLYGDLSIFSWRLKQYIQKRLGLPSSMGIASNRHVAKVASKCAKQNGLVYVLPGEEELFLAPLPIDSLQGVGERTRNVLVRRGITRVGQLAQAPPEFMTRLLGKWGGGLQLKALGYGSDNCERVHDQKSIGAETTFSEDTADMAYIRREVGRLVSRVGYSLRQKGWMACTLCIKVRYTDFKTVSKRRSITMTNHDDVLFQLAILLLESVVTRRVRVRLVGVSVSKLMKEQVRSLFKNDQKNDDLYNAIDQVKGRYGSKAIQTALASAPPKE